MTRRPVRPGDDGPIQSRQRARDNYMSISAETTKRFREHPGSCDKARRARPRTGRDVVVLMLCLILAATVATPTNATKADAQGANEYDLKAAIIFNFAKFVEWPPGAFANDSAPIVVGIVGDDPFRGSLDAVGGKSVNGRVVTVRRLNAGQDLRSCHVLFVSSSEKRHLPQIVTSLDGASVLTVGEMDGFANNGGMIKLKMEENKVRFVINAGLARRARLKISSKLLSLATEVIN